MIHWPVSYSEGAISQHYDPGAHAKIEVEETFLWNGHSDSQFTRLSVVDEGFVPPSFCLLKRSVMGGGGSQIFTKLCVHNGLGYDIS